jgi:hypothetical protein
MRSWRHPVSNRPLVAYILGGFVGGAAALLFATGALEEGSFDLSPTALAPPSTLLGTTAAGVAATVGGVVAGWFLVALILAWTPGRIRCPRCGTSNRRSATSCGACQLQLN